MAAGKLTPAVLDHPLFRWSGRTAETYRDLAARLGLPMAPLRRGYEAAGFAPRRNPTSWSVRTTSTSSPPSRRALLH
jgi:hypothetical protein